MTDDPKIPPRPIEEPNERPDEIPPDQGDVDFPGGGGDVDFPGGAPDEAPEQLSSR